MDHRPLYRTKTVAVPPVRHEEGYAPNSRLYKWTNPQGRRSDCAVAAGCSPEIIGIV